MSNPTGINQYTGRSRFSRATTRSEINRVLVGQKGTRRGDAERMKLADDIKRVAKKLGGGEFSKHKALAGLSRASVMRADVRNQRRK